jgi:glycosyltransferase involved in cell wall biosynthesis
MGKRTAIVSQPFSTVRPPNDKSSLQIWTYQIARRLAETGDATVFVCLGGKRFRSSDKYVDGIRYRFAPTIYDRVGERIHKAFSRVRSAVVKGSDVRRPTFASIFHHLSYSVFIAFAARRERCEIIHIFNYSQFVSVIRILNPDAKIVLHMQCDWLAQLDPQLVEHRLRKTNLVLGCADYITDRIRHAFPAHEAKCKTVYNGVPLPADVVERDRKPDDSFHLLYVGRVSPEKGIHVLLEAFREVATRFPNVKLDIIGATNPAPREFIVALSDNPKVSKLDRFYDGGYASHLAKIMNGKLKDSVSFLGEIPNVKLEEHYRSADVFVFPPVWDEPFGMPPVEAMAAGIPVVASRSGGIAETIQDGVTGILVPTDDVTALSEAISRLLGDANLRKRMGKAGRHLAETRFSWNRIADDLQNAYDVMFPA